jgi:hypothetical protein
MATAKVGPASASVAMALLLVTTSHRASAQNGPASAPAANDSNAEWFGYSIVSVDNVAGRGSDTFPPGQYGLANLRYYPTDRVMLGGEVLYGVREDRDGSTGDDLRLQFSAQYRF